MKELDLSKVGKDLLEKLNQIKELDVSKVGKDILKKLNQMKELDIKKVGKDLLEKFDQKVLRHFRSKEDFANLLEVLKAKFKGLRKQRKDS